MDPPKSFFNFIQGGQLLCAGGSTPLTPPTNTALSKCHYYSIGGSWVVVPSFKFRQNWLSGYRDVREGSNLSYCITLAVGL